MKIRDVVIGAAIGVWLVAAFPTSHAHVGATAPRPASHSSAAPATSHPPARPSPSPSHQRPALFRVVSTSPAGPPGGSWLIGSLCVAAIAVSALTVSMSARQGRGRARPSP